MGDDLLDCEMTLIVIVKGRDPPTVNLTKR